jgi:hypothetical protein
MLLILTKPQVTIFTALCLGIWLLRRKPAAIQWSAVWLMSLLGAATLAMPRWWSFDYTGFGQGLTYYLEGANGIAGKRVAATIYDLLTYGLGITGLLHVLLAGAVAILGSALLVWVWRRFNEPVTLAAAATILTLLITPYALLYDFVLLTLAFMLILKGLPGLRLPMRTFVLILLALSILIQFWAKLQFQAYLILLAIAACFSISICSLPMPNTLSKSTTA